MSAGVSPATRTQRVRTMTKNGTSALTIELAELKRDPRRHGHGHCPNYLTLSLNPVPAAEMKTPRPSRGVVVRVMELKAAG